MYSKIYLRKNEDKRILNGHLWVFSNEISRIEGDVENGDLVDVYSFKNEFVGCGFYNKNSLIAIRILAFGKIDNLENLLKDKILKAGELRKIAYPSRKSFRLVFSESDFLPGLIIDKYNSTFVLQIYSFGMQKNIECIVKILKDDFEAENIFTKNESYFRRLEGLPEEDEILLGEIKNETINDGSINYLINFATGHKTGFYFDQSDNRFFIEKFAKNKSCLDAFCNSGGFGLHALIAGAASVEFVDSSSTEIKNVKTNYELNKLSDEVAYTTFDVFDFLEKCIVSNKKYDMVIIDPPAFAKNKKSLPQAKKGYEKLNKLAINVINNDGILITSSCSHHLDKDDFIQIVNNAANKAGKNIQLLHFYGASLDHPQIPAMNETAYLKFGIFLISNKR